MGNNEPEGVGVACRRLKKNRGKIRLSEKKGSPLFLVSKFVHVLYSPKKSLVSYHLCSLLQYRSCSITSSLNLTQRSIHYAVHGDAGFPGPLELRRRPFNRPGSHPWHWQTAGDVCLHSIRKIVRRVVETLAKLEQEPYTPSSIRLLQYQLTIGKEQAWTESTQAPVMILI